AQGASTAASPATMGKVECPRWLFSASASKAAIRPLGNAGRTLAIPIGSPSSRVPGRRRSHDYSPSVLRAAAFGGNTMTYLFNDPADFATDAVAGLAAAHPEHVAVVHGGVVRATETPTGQPARVIGGGSGHYPAVAGRVGPGMGHGAPCGNIFSSPSASQVYSVARNAEAGGGVILGFGNYAGDVLHFGAAAEKLRAEGVDVRIIKVSDDIVSNSPENHRDRRGIAGDLPVFKIAGAAIEAGADLDEAERIAWKANDATRSFGVAFDGPTLPGADEALFHVEDGQMGVGLGIHGEP